MKAMPWTVALAWAGTLAAQAGDVVIRSFDTSGKVAFNEVSNATRYRVEWSSGAGGGWTNSWDLLNDIPASGSGIVTASVPMWYRVVATVPSAPSSDMAPIPAGAFLMGDSFAEGDSGELPVHSAQVSAFYMDRHEVTKAFWDDVYSWATNHGYAFDNAGAGKAPTHPVQTVSWYDAVKWCNARSEKDGLSPCYTVGVAVYKSGQSAADCNWTTNGYRLPTEAEWEKAARSGVPGHRFPWTDNDFIDHGRANYYSYWLEGVRYYAYDKAAVEGYCPAYATGDHPYTSPAGSLAANGYGLYDMAGNVWEWCWDWYGSYPLESQSDPRGATNGTYRVLRGGCWDGIADSSRCANRDVNFPDGVWTSDGFRCVRGP